MTARLPQHSVYLVQSPREHRNGAARQLRAIRHREVRRLMAPLTFRQRARHAMDWAIVAFVGLVIGGVAAVGVLIGAWLLFQIAQDILRAATGGGH